MIKSLILFAKLILFATIFTLVSCSFSNDAKPLAQEEDDESAIRQDDESAIQHDDGTEEKADNDSEKTAAEEDAEISDSDSYTEPDNEPEIPEEEKIKSVVIGTYNTHLFFDTNCDSQNCSGSDFENLPTNSEYTAKVSDLADSVKEIGADIILLQEIEKDSCLKDLFEKSGDYDEFYLGERGYSASIDTGVMTKGKITYKNLHASKIECEGCEDGKTTFSHTFLETHITLGRRKIIVFSAHFKSKNDDDPSRRLAEAAAAVKILKITAEKYPDALIVMGGDLNDEPGSDTLKYFENDPAFLRVADELSSKNQATYSYHGNAIALDHIFWVKTDGGTYKKDSAEVVKDAPSTYSLGSSDHAALKAVFEF